MSLAESAVLLCLHTIGMCLLILSCIVITLLALCACQCDLGTHIYSPPYASVFATQKKDLRLLLNQYNIVMHRTSMIIFEIRCISSINYLYVSVTQEISLQIQDQPLRTEQVSERHSALYACPAGILTGWHC